MVRQPLTGEVFPQSWLGRTRRSSDPTYGSPTSRRRSSSSGGWVFARSRGVAWPMGPRWCGCAIPPRTIRSSCSGWRPARRSIVRSARSAPRTARSSSWCATWSWYCGACAPTVPVRKRSSPTAPHAWCFCAVLGGAVSSSSLRTPLAPGRAVAPAGFGGRRTVRLRSGGGAALRAAPAPGRGDLRGRGRALVGGRGDPAPPREVRPIPPARRGHRAGSDELLREGATMPRPARMPMRAGPGPGSARLSASLRGRADAPTSRASSR